MTINEFAALPDFDKTVVIKEKATFLNKQSAGANNVMYYYSFAGFFIEVEINFKAVTYQIKASEKNLIPAKLLNERRTIFYRGNNFFGNLN